MDYIPEDLLNEVMNADVDTAARLYHRITEDFDRQVCSGVDLRYRAIVAMPVNAAELARINRFASELRARMQRHFDPDELKNAIKHYVRSGQLDRDERSNWDRPPFQIKRR